MTTDIDARVCCGGLICEEHPDRAWPDGDPDCSGPGMPCLHPSAQDEALRQAVEALREAASDLHYLIPSHVGPLSSCEGVRCSRNNAAIAAIEALEVKHG